jgi:hypothetical protein
MRSLWEKPELCDGSDAVGQLTNGLPEPPLSRLSHGSSISHRIGVEFQISTQHKTLVAAGLPAVAYSVSPPPANRATTDFPTYRDLDSYRLIVPTLRVVTQWATLRVNLDAERPIMHSHAEPGNDQLRPMLSL